MDLFDIVDTAGGIVAAVAFAGILLMLPLYISQRRDLIRLREWMDRDPSHPAADVAASETILDRAEAELEELLGEPAPATEVRPPSPAARVTSERPALTRITMEREALKPHPHWRQFAARMNQPRILIAIAIGAVVLGMAGIYWSDEILQRDDERGGGRMAAVNPRDVEVAVLNASSVPGLAANVGDDVRQNDYQLGAVTTSPEAEDRSTVFYDRGQREAAEKVARDLGIKPVESMGAEVRRLAEGADVAVVAGEERAQ